MNARPSVHTASTHARPSPGPHTNITQERLSAFGTPQSTAEASSLHPPQSDTYLHHKPYNTEASVRLAVPSSPCTSHPQTSVEASKLDPSQRIKEHLNSLMPERLISRPPGVLRQILHRHILLRTTRPRARQLLSTPHIRTPHPLIRIRRLLDPNAPSPTLAVSPILVVVGTAPGTAAHAEEPEDAGAEGEGYRKPDGAVHTAAEGAVDTVGLEDRIEGAGERRVEGCGGNGEGDCEEGLDLHDFVSIEDCEMSEMRELRG
jgi:hypothetical protein